MKIVIEWLKPPEGGRGNFDELFAISRYAAFTNFPGHKERDLTVILENLVHDGVDFKSVGDVVEEFSDIPKKFFVAGQAFEIHELALVARARFEETAELEERAYVPVKPLPKKAAATEAQEMEEVFAMLSSRAEKVPPKARVAKPPPKVEPKAEFISLL